jgi:hypothetical protein
MPKLNLPASEATDADAVLLAKRSHHTVRILGARSHRSSHIIANDLEIEHAAMFSVGCLRFGRFDNSVPEG